MCRTFHFYLFINYAFYACSTHSQFWSINIFFVIFLILDHSLFQMLPTLSFICVWINFRKFSNKPTQTICLSNILDFLWHIVTLRYFHNIYIYIYDIYSNIGKIIWLSNILDFLWHIVTFPHIHIRYRMQMSKIFNFNSRWKGCLQVAAMS